MEDEPTNDVLDDAAQAQSYDREDVDDVADSGLAATVGTAAMSTLLAASLVGALSESPDTRLVTLPEPTPIVRVYREDEPEEPVPEPEDDAIEEVSFWRRLLKLLKYLLVALIAAGVIIFGALKGCASCSAGTLVNGDDERQEQQVQPA